MRFNRIYDEMLHELTLEYRRKRSDVIQTYKIMNNIDRIDGKKFFKPCKEVRTRGQSKRVEKTQCKSLVRRNAFSQRMVNDWNALPDAVVLSGSIKGDSSVTCVTFSQLFSSFKLCR